MQLCFLIPSKKLELNLYLFRKLVSPSADNADIVEGSLVYNKSEGNKTKNENDIF